MYLVSLYFDKQTDYILSNLMKQIAKKGGNSYMLERQIPPHLTIGMVKQGKETDLLQHLACIIFGNRVEQSIARNVCRCKQGIYRRAKQIPAISLVATYYDGKNVE